MKVWLMLMSFSAMGMLACSVGPDNRKASSELETETEQALSGPACGTVCDPTSQFSFNAAGTGADCSAALSDAVFHARPVARQNCISEGYMGICQFSLSLTSCQFSSTFNAYHAVAVITSSCSETNC